MEKKTKIITVTSCKGGTGKTTMLLNLAGIYSNNDKKILIMDFDLYSSAISVMLNLNPNNDLYTLMEDINSDRFDHISSYTTKYNKNIDVLAAPKDIRMSSYIDSRFVGTILSKIREQYDIVLIDTNHFLNDVNLTLLENSDNILYVITNDAVDMKNMRQMINIYNDMGRKNYFVLLNESIYKGRHLYTKYDADKFLKREIDFHVYDKFNIKDIDKYIVEGKILTLDKKICRKCRKTIFHLKFVAAKLLITEGKER